MLMVHTFYDLKDYVHTFTDIKNQFKTQKVKMTNPIKTLNLKNPIT